MTTIFVTGAAGMIGSNICKKLITDGNRVVGVDNLWRGKISNIETLLDHKNFEFRHADISNDFNWYSDINSNSVIIHTADIVAGIGYVFSNEWWIFQKNNLINTQIARIVHQHKPAQLIYLGTACSYPQTMQRSTSNSVLMETDKFPADPESGYGWSKLLGDIEFNLVTKDCDTRLTVLDLHNVYGWPCIYQDSTSQVLPALINKAINSTDGTITVWGDGKQGRAFLHVSDVVQAVQLSLSYQGDYSNFMIGPNICTEIGKLAKLILTHSRIGANEVIFDTSKPVGDIGRYSNSSRAEQELGWIPATVLKQGVFDLIDSIIAHKTANN